MITINQYLEENKERFLNELFELIRIPSISSQSEHKQDMYRCAEKWVELMLSAGVDRAQVFETKGHPVAYGEKILDPSYKTVLIYGHMDVMPVDPIDLWHTDPFEPVVKDGKMSSDKKYKGKMPSVMNKYCNDVLEEFNTPDLDKVFITYTSATPEMIASAEAVCKEAGFKNIYKMCLEQ